MDGRFAPAAPPVAHAALRLWLARALAWALLLGGWLVLGALGHATARGGAAAALPLASWLLTIGGLLALAPRLRLAMPALAAGIAIAAAATALPLAGPQRFGPAAPLLVALGWALLLVLVSRVVQALRGVQALAAPAPLGPAFAGAVAAWVMAGDPLAVSSSREALALALVAAPVGLIALLPRAALPVPGCRAGLFDCSLPLPWGAGWRAVADWPLHAAALAMLPMMAGLPTMAEWCAGGGLDARETTALHLAAMVAPAWLLRGALPRLARPRLRGVVALLLLAGGAMLLFGAQREAMLAGTLLHAVAWSLAWAAPMLARDGPPRRATGRRAQAAAGVAAAAVVLLLAALASDGGPQVLRSTHLALTLLALAGVVAAAVPSRRSGG